MITHTMRFRTFIITITVHQGHAQSVFELLISKLFSFRRACKLKFYCFNRSKDRHTEKMSRSIQLRNRKIGLISLGIIVAALIIVELLAALGVLA